MAEELETAHGYRHDREDASYGEAQVERKEAPYGAKNRARDETGHRRRERVNDRLADPTPARLVPIHVGTRDPVDRVGASRKRLLSDRRYRRGEDEQREDPPRPARASNGHAGEDAKPDDGYKYPGRYRCSQHTLPRYPRQMQRPK